MLILLLFSVVSLTLVFAGSVVKDYHKAPLGWQNIGRAPREHVLYLRIGLSQSDFPELVRQLYQVSDPQHPTYGQHLSKAQVHELVKPRDDTFADIEDWLEQNDLDLSELTYNSARTWAKISITVAEAERLLDTEYSIWKHTDGSSLVRTESYSLPAHLHEHVTTIQPTNSWARTSRRTPMNEVRSFNHHAVGEAVGSPPAISDASPCSFADSVAAACNFSAVTPNCLRTLYGTINYTASSNSQSKLGVANYLGEYNNRSDTYLFLQKYRPEAANAAYSFQQNSIAGGAIDNGTNTADLGTATEGNLDSEYILGLGFPLELTTWGTGGLNPTFMPDLFTPNNSDEPFLVWTDYILGQSNIPQVISTSYGDDEQTVSKAYAEAVCNEFAQLGAMGITVLFASGDNGVGDDSSCYSNFDDTTYQFLPGFPNDCPFVTNVGGTTRYPETAMDVPLSIGGRYASGAGFSNYFEAPRYQKDAVDKYVSGLNGLHDGFYNKSGMFACICLRTNANNLSGRAYPDIACMGQRFPTIW